MEKMGVKGFNSGHAVRSQRIEIILKKWCWDEVGDNTGGFSIFVVVQKWEKGGRPERKKCT